ncbi:oleosin-B6-like [Xenopus tropicalis]|uniref:Oleosin-B6-like n=1 Tax=Xenopus tropicalis TaxID=8364 RepID=A0A8J0R129_XENTR|nr:oleosin-B6-like [Xenopus tropicalis]|eukprot:XP_004916099.1 PREDICTED: oleosin-B6-like [Xenopus tropicalis]
MAELHLDVAPQHPPEAQPQPQAPLDAHQAPEAPGAPEAPAAPQDSPHAPDSPQAHYAPLAEDWEKASPPADPDEGTSRQTEDVGTQTTPCRIDLTLRSMQEDLATMKAQLA